MQPKLQGFDESDDQRLASKSPTKNKQPQPNNTFFALPEAKPLLNKNILDPNKPKILIKQIPFSSEPIQLINYHCHKQVFSLDKPHSLRLMEPLPSALTSIWDRYILSQLYTMLYLKFYKENVQQLQRKGFRRYKNQLQKMCRNQTYLFSTYLIDLGFLSDAGSYLMRNVKETTLQQASGSVLEEDIVFDSRFQSGNLFAAFQRKKSVPLNVLNFRESQKQTQVKQFDLVLQSDINSKGYSNWFYFSIRNRHKGTFKFNIVNLQKVHSLFNDGMKVVVFSKKKLQNQNIQWHRDGYYYNYFKNDIRKSQQNQQTYNTLTFCYDAKYDNDLIYFAANLPYSYSRLLKYIDSIQKITKLNSKLYFKRDTIAHTISSNLCPVLTLTWKNQKIKQLKKKKKKIIGIIARQHPSETVASYVMQGFINSLVYLNNQGAVKLLQNYIFKIVPMVNVDGVIYGNSRCDISGTDINRKWTKYPNKFMYPVLSGIKSMFNNLVSEQYEIDYFIDLHGHSRKMGAFIFGCKGSDEIQARYLSWVLSTMNSKFLFEECLFGLSPGMRETARGAMADLVVKKRSVTLQTSFFGYRGVSSKHFQVKDLEKLGATLIDALYAETSREPKIFNWDSIQNDIKQSIELTKTKNKTKIKQNQEDSDQESNFCSDSDPQQDQMTQNQKKQHFLDPTIANKIGLNEVKIVKKKSKKQEEDENQKKNNELKYESLFEKNQEKNNSLADKNFESLQSKMTTELPVRKQIKLNIRKSRSTTKITPFKFSDRLDKPVSLERISTKNRASVDTINIGQQKLSAPSVQFPIVQTKTNFWSNLKKQYENILIQHKLEGKAIIRMNNNI